MGSLQDSSDGKVYQIEVPALLSQNEYLANSKNPFELEFGPGASCDSNGISREKGILKLKISAKPHTDSGNEDLLVEHESALESGESSIQGSKQEGKQFRNQGYGDQENFLVPSFCDDSWSKIDEASFLLGLYIFGKNFVPVKKFVGNQKMGAILSFYYGNFYKSKEYQRWKDCRKMRIRRCVHGQKIFTGLRLQELLSRLYPQVLEECQQTLLEVSKSYVDGKMVLDEYVFTLKAIVGTNSLVEAVAIGRGKLDLTWNAIEPSKSNQIVPGNKERTPIQVTDCMKVTVVDTSSADGELFKVRQFCPLPSEEVTKIPLSVSSSSSEESNDEKPVLLTTALQRQSTRNRIPTPRALEALANGYLTSRRTRKKKDKEIENIFYDTNIPRLSPDMKTGASLMGGSDRDVPKAAKPSTELVSSKKQENTASQRQSTRNRSPTARVLEAVANGYLTTNTRKKKYCQRSRFGTEVGRFQNSPERDPPEVRRPHT